MLLSKKIASFCSDFKAMPIPKVVIDKAIEAIVDGTGVGIAAKNYDFSKIIIGTLREFSEFGDISIFGQKIKLSLRDSILANSALIHGLDLTVPHILEKNKLSPPFETTTELSFISTLALLSNLKDNSPSFPLA